VVPEGLFFSRPELRRGPGLDRTIVYGPPEGFRPAWLAGILDYLKEPWDPEELYLRLRGPIPPFVAWSWGTKSLRLEGTSLSGPGLAGIRLSAAEAGILGLLVQRRGAVVSRAVLAWAAACTPGRVVDTLVARVRTKVRRAAGESGDPVMSVRGLGYRIP